MGLKVLNRPVKQLHYGPRKSNTYYPVQIVPMTVSLVRTWHSKVQTIIDKSYFHAHESQKIDAAASAAGKAAAISTFRNALKMGQSASAALKAASVESAQAEQRERDRVVRADVNWNWWKNLLLVQIHNTARTANSINKFNKSGRAYAWSVVVTNGKNGQQHPIGMLTTVPQFHSELLGSSRERAFVWYLADAPKETYAALGIQIPHGMAQALIDTAIQNRLDLPGDLDATTFLHADPNAGSKLVNYYLRQGMTQLTGTWPRITPTRVFKSGEYFAFDHAGALTFCQQLDQLR